MIMAIENLKVMPKTKKKLKEKLKANNEKYEKLIKHMMANLH